MLFFLLLMLFRSIYHQVSHQADKFDLLAIQLTNNFGKLHVICG